MVGCYGEDICTENGKELSDSAAFNNLKITNGFFRRKDTPEQLENKNQLQIT